MTSSESGQCHTLSPCRNQSHRHRCRVALKAERFRDADGRGVCVERPVLREQSGGKGTAGEMGDGIISEAAAAEAGMGDDVEVGDGAAPCFISTECGELAVAEDARAGNIEGRTAVVPLLFAARFTMRTRPDIVLRMKYPR